MRFVIVLNMILCFGFLSLDRNLQAQIIEQEISNYSNLPDSTLRVESCVYLDEDWYCSLYTSYYFLHPQVHAQLIKVNSELQVVATSDQPDRQWNFLFSEEPEELDAFGVQYISPTETVLMGGRFDTNLDSLDNQILSDTVLAGILYDVVKHVNGYTLLFGHLNPFEQYHHYITLIEINNDLEVVRQQEFDQFPEIYQWTPRPNQYRLVMTSAGDYAIVGDNVTWLSQEDMEVMTVNNIMLLYSEFGFYVGKYLGSVLPGENQRVLIAASVFGDEVPPQEMAVYNDVGILAIDTVGPEDELFKFGKPDTNDAPPLKGFIAVEDGYLLAGQSYKYWYFWGNDETTELDWPTSTLLTKLNAEMEPEWELYLKDDHQTNVHGIAQDPEAGILLYGQRRYLDSDEYYAHLVLLPNDPVGIEAIKDEDVLVYPNPTTHAVRLQLPAIFNPTVDIFIYNLAGKCIAENLSFDSQQQLPMNYPPGMYILEVRDADKAVRTKVVVK